MWVQILWWFFVLTMVSYTFWVMIATRQSKDEDVMVDYPGRTDVLRAVQDALQDEELTRRADQYLDAVFLRPDNPDHYWANVWSGVYAGVGPHCVNCQPRKL